MNHTNLYSANIVYPNPANSDSHHSTFFNQLAIKCATDFLKVFVNLTLIVQILAKQNVRHCHRVVNWLIAHSAILSILTIVADWFNTSNIVHLINVSGYLCSLVSFLRSVFHSTLFVNMLIITYERLQSFQPEVSTSSLQKTAKLIFAAWATSVLFCLPTAWMKTGIEKISTDTTYFNTSKPLILGNCKSVQLLGFWEATLGYEILRFLVFYIGIGCYLIYASIKIRSRVQYFVTHSNIPHQRLDQHLSCIRLIYFYLFSFSMVQFPLGVIVFYRRVLLLRFGGNLPKFTDVLAAIDMYLFPIIIFNLHMSPLVSYLFLKGLTLPCAICFCQQRQTTINSDEQDDGSIIATYAVTTTADSAGLPRICQSSEHGLATEESEQTSKVNPNAKAQCLETSV